MSTDETISTERLDLPILTAQVLQAVVAADWPAARAALPFATPEVLPEGLAGVARFRVPQLAADPSVAPWLLRAMVLRVERRMIGHIGLHDAPDERGFVEIGYTVYEPYRRQGFAEEAARALFGWAARQPGASGARACVAPDNTPSLRMVEKFGLTEVGRAWDDIDGEEIVFEGPLPLV